jgi:hypothetical protein
MENARFEFSVRIEEAVSSDLPLPIFDSEKSLIGAFTVYHETLLKGFIAAHGWPDSLFAEEGLWFTLGKDKDHATVTSQKTSDKSSRINSIERGIL